ncbi:KR-domain-containing protein [Bimuria novae-zelandiae CBS 107.79]|uniref:KR-domain-containing protein n=1 Tax=Bimuria novae-zelandiae CBS 107.79 TaxID=1447943 RepID=A0A6A5US39_9PLEO|nr:KR-domain-containing protein [Bimuria novae-zelandiae CBS 107.79]
MTYQKWVEATRGKVKGSWNFHKHLPNFDFFVILSSFATIFGNRGQTNYSAAGAYEDALAYHRRVRGYRATTLDLSIMRDIGVLAETGFTDSLRAWEKPYGIREAWFHALMERAIEGDMKGTVTPQIVTGLATGGSAIATGIDVPFYFDNARFSILSRTGIRSVQSSTATDSAPTYILVSQVASLKEATATITEALVKQVAKMLQIPTSEIGSSRFLHSYGIESLVVIEILNWALKEVQAGITEVTGSSVM